MLLRRQRLKLRRRICHRRQSLLMQGRRNRHSLSGLDGNCIVRIRRLQLMEDGRHSSGGTSLVPTTSIIRDLSRGRVHRGGRLAEHNDGRRWRRRLGRHRLRWRQLCRRWRARHAAKIFPLRFPRSRRWTGAPVRRAGRRHRCRRITCPSGQRIHRGA